MLYYCDDRFPDENEMKKIKEEKDDLTFMTYVAIVAKKMVSVGNKGNKRKHNAVSVVYVDEDGTQRALNMCAESEALKVFRTMRKTNDEHIMFSGCYWEKRAKEKVPFFYLHKIQDGLSEEDMPYYRVSDINLMEDKGLSSYAKRRRDNSARIVVQDEALDMLERCLAAHPNYKVTTHKTRMKLMDYSESKHPLMENELHCELLDRYCRCIVSDLSFKCIFSSMLNLEKYKQKRVLVEYKKVTEPDGTVYRNIITDVSPIRVSYKRVYEYDNTLIRFGDANANAKTLMKDTSSLTLIEKSDIKMEVFVAENGRNIVGRRTTDVVCRIKGKKNVQRLSIAFFTRDEIAYVMRSGGIIYLPKCEVYYNSEDGRTILSPTVIQSFAPDVDVFEQGNMDTVKYDKRVKEMMRIKNAFAKVKGNEEAKNSLAALISRWKVNKEKCSIFLGGSTGSGKDYLMSCIQELYPDSFAFADCSGISEAGYSGRNFKDTLMTSISCLKRGERGIIALNEFDALCRPSVDVSGRDMHHAVQKEVLCALDGTEAGTDEIMFIMMGSNQIERELIEAANSHSIGFETDDEDASQVPLTPHELSVEGGMITELAARIDHFITTVPLTVSEIQELCEEKIDEVVNKYYDEGVEIEFTRQFSEQFESRAVELAESEGVRAIKNVFNIMFSPAVDYEISLKKARGESIVIDVGGVQSQKVAEKGGI